MYKPKRGYYKKSRGAIKRLSKEEVLESKLTNTREVEIVDFLEPRTTRRQTIILPAVIAEGTDFKRFSTIAFYIKRDWLKNGIPTNSNIGRLMISAGVEKIGDLKGKKVVM